MLDQLKKVLGGASAKTVTQEEQMSKVEDNGVKLEDVLSQVTSLTNLLAEKESLLAEMTGKLASLQQYAEEAEAKAAAIAAEAKAKEVADKKAQLADVIGADNPAFDTTWQAVESLDVNSFNVVVSGFKAALAKEAESPFFKELGVDGEADLSKTSEESREMALLKAKYQSK